MFEIELLPQAENELAEAFDWYEEQLVGLGNKLYKEIDYYLTAIGKIHTITQSNTRVIFMLLH